MRNMMMLVVMMMMMMMMMMVMLVVMMMEMTNKLSAVYLISYSASKIPRVLPLLSYYTFGREGGMIKNIISFTKHSGEIFLQAKRVITVLVPLFPHCNCGGS